MSAPREPRSTSSRWSRPAAERRPLFAVLLLAAVLLAAPGAAQPPPEVEAAFVIDPTSVFATTKLTPAQQAQVREQVSRRLAELSSTHFGFVRWRAAGQPGATPVARLAVTLRDVPKGSGSANVLVLSRRTGDSNVPLARIAPTVVYEWFDLPKPSDPAVITADVAEKLEELFGRDAFRRELHEQFLKGVPLAQEVVAHDGDKRIIVPLSWDAMRPGSESVLRVTFMAPQQKRGEMELSLVKKRPGQPKPGALQGAIKLFDCAPLTLSTLGDWNAQIPALLAGAKQVRVFMASYVPDVAPDVDDGLVTSPD